MCPLIFVITEERTTEARMKLQFEFYNRKFEVYFEVFYLSGDSSPVTLAFRWFKFTLKPPNSVMHGNLLWAIWDTSHWNFLVKFGLKTAWHISCDILWSLLTYVNFWWLQGCLSTFAKIRGPQKIKVFSMKERSVVDEAWGGFRWADSWATWWYHFFGGATHLRGAGGRRKKKIGIFQDICDSLKGTRNWSIGPRISL